MKPLLPCLAAAVLALAVGHAFAAKTVEVARIKLTLNEDRWTASAELPYRRELMSAQGSFSGGARVLTLNAPDGTPQAVMYVGATWGKPQVYTEHGGCEPNPGLYVRDLNTDKRENVRCLYFGGPVDAAALLQGPLSSLQDAASSTPVGAPKEAYVLLLYMTANGGVQIHIEALIAPELAGLVDAQPVGSLPAGLPPAAAAWADALAASALKALTSFSGALPVPPLDFPAPSK